MNIKKILIVILAAGFLYFQSGCVRPVKKSGRISGSSIWQGKVILEGDVYVENGALLTIMPGTEITYSSGEIKLEIQRLTSYGGATYDLFRENNIEIIIDGDILINGTEEEPVKISAGKKNQERAGGINFIGYKSSSTITNLIIAGGYTGIRIYNSRAPVISSVTISGMSVAAIGCWNRAAPDINYADINNNKYGIGASDLASPLIKNSEITDNSASGVFFEGESRGVISESFIDGNNVGVACGNISRPEILSNKITGNGSGVGLWDDCRPVVKDNLIKSNIAGVLLLNNSYGEIDSNEIRENGGGITMNDSSSGSITSNVISGHGAGIILKNSGETAISDNDFMENEYGIRVELHAEPLVSNNWFRANRVGILITDYSSPLIQGNSFEDNLNETIDSRIGDKE